MMVNKLRAASPAGGAPSEAEDGSMRQRSTLSELDFEIESLVVADRDIAEGQRRIDRQRDLVDRLRRNFESVQRAEELLDLFCDTLAIWRDHRVQILRRIDYLKGKAAQHAVPVTPFQS
jgi:hypothetical protein